jgi:hypothetical protein
VALAPRRLVPVVPPWRERPRPATRYGALVSARTAALAAILLTSVHAGAAPLEPPVPTVPIAPTVPTVPDGLAPVPTAAVAGPEAPSSGPGLRAPSPAPPLVPLEHYLPPRHAPSPFVRDATTLPLEVRGSWSTRVPYGYRLEPRREPEVLGFGLGMFASAYAASLVTSIMKLEGGRPEPELWGLLSVPVVGPALALAWADENGGLSEGMVVLLVCDQIVQSVGALTALIGSAKMPYFKREDRASTRGAPRAAVRFSPPLGLRF